MFYVWIKKENSNILIEIVTEKWENPMNNFQNKQTE